jgi:hypothetical protein
VHPTLLEAVRIASENVRQPPDGGEVFTDNQAPLEWITNQMVLTYLLTDSDLDGVEVP